VQAEKTGSVAAAGVRGDAGPRRPSGPCPGSDSAGAAEPARTAGRLWLSPRHLRGCCCPGYTPPMLGDVGPKGGGVSAEGFKVGENESPRPLDRLFTTFNYYNNVRKDAFRQASFGQADVYRELFGLEKTSWTVTFPWACVPRC
jgi:hypothetical protein